jgi:hypothetical protein
MKKQVRLNTSKLRPLTPYIPAGNELLEQQTTLAVLEARVCGQQSRLHDCDRFIATLKKENAALRTLAKNMKEAIFQNLTMRPTELGKQ